jgi:hypothetical protein
MDASNPRKVNSEIYGSCDSPKDCNTSAYSSALLWYSSFTSKGWHPLAKAISLLDSWNERTSGLSSSSGVPPLHYHRTISSITLLSALHMVYVPERLYPSWLTRTLIHFSTSNPTPLWTSPTICGSALITETSSPNLHT